MRKAAPTVAASLARSSRSRVGQQQHRWVLGSMDPTALGGGPGVAEQVRDVIAFSKPASFDPDNMGCVLGGDDVGLGTDCAHLEGPQQEEKQHKKIGATMDQLFPVGGAPVENAMEIATAPSAEELASRDAMENLKDLVRDRYRKTQDAKEAERRRVSEADTILQV